MKKYLLHSIYYSIIDSCTYAGTPAIFIRFANCNLCCPFCFTEKHRRMDATKLEVLQEVQKLVPKHTPKFHKMPIVITGGEPLLQLDEDLVTTLSIHGFELHLETNGTLLAVSRDYFKSITISPKTSHPIRPIQMWMQNNEGSGKIYLNVIYDTRRPEWLSQVMEGWRHLPWTRKFLQPCMRTMEGPNIDEVLAYCQSHPDWAISLQFHKILALDR